MNLGFTLEQITTVINGKREFSNDSLSSIQRITSLEKATPNDLAVILDRGNASVFDQLSLDKITSSNAGVFIATRAIVPGKNYILVDDALAAFNTLIALAKKTELETHAALPDSDRSNITVGRNAVIEPSATIGQHTTVSALCYIGKHCTIGTNVILHPSVTILDHCVVGDYSIIHAGTVVGSDGFGYQVNATGLRKIPQIGNVVIGKGVEIGANCSIDRATFDATIISDGVKIDNNVHIAHNVFVGQSSVILAQTAIAGSARIGIGCQIGGQVAIKDNVVLGDGVKVVSKSGVLTDIAAGQTVAGIPAIPFNDWKRLTVIFKKLPELYKQTQQPKPRPSFFKFLFGK
ncbi:MAG: UDP-3-O-(3-hydroxymyristoyl)glucosamine N-acyltransferase [Candidatus Babeliales bacterium]